MKALAAIVVAGLLSGCASTPTEPTVSVLIGKHKAPSTFADDDILCRHYATAQIDGAAAHANWLQAATTGGPALLGAGLGGLLGGGKGAVIGAGTGAAGGAAFNYFSGGRDTQAEIQRSFDRSYATCQLAHGNRVAVPDDRKVMP